MAAPAFVQEKDAILANGTSISTATLAYTSDNSLGNLLVCVVSWFNNLANTPNNVTVAVTDSAGNSWKSIPLRHHEVGSGGNQDQIVQFWYALGAKAGPNTVTFTFSGGNGNYSSAAIAEYSGVNAIDNYDNEASLSNSGIIGDSTSATAADAQAAATHDSTELIIGYAQSNAFSSWTVSGSWTLRSAATNLSVALEDQNAGNGSYNSAFTLGSSAYWTVGTVTFYQTDSSQFRQEFDHDDGSASLVNSDVMTFFANVAAGDLLFLNTVFLNGQSGGSQTSHISSVTDTQGNTWVSLPQIEVYSGDPGFGQAWYALNCKAGPTTITVAYSGAGSDYIGASISEWSGVNAVDSYAQHQITNATAASPSITTTHACLLVGYAVTEDGFVTMTPASGWTPRTANLRSVWLQSQFSQPAGTYTSTVSGNGGNRDTNAWMSGIIAFYQKPSRSTRSK